MSEGRAGTSVRSTTMLEAKSRTALLADRLTAPGQSTQVGVASFSAMTKTRGLLAFAAAFWAFSSSERSSEPLGMSNPFASEMRVRERRSCIFTEQQG